MVVSYIDHVLNMSQKINVAFSDDPVFVREVESKNKICRPSHA